MILWVRGRPPKLIEAGQIWRNQTISVGPTFYRDVTLMVMGPATHEDYVEWCKEQGCGVGNAKVGDEYWKVSVD